MKPMSILELQTFVTSIESKLVGAQLQEVISNDRGLALGFRGGGHFWLVLDMNPASPFCLLFYGESSPFKKGPKPKPLALFLNAHAKNLSLRKITIDEKYGRVLNIELCRSEKATELQVVLIPKQANILVQSEGKKIAWEKPKELKFQNEKMDLPVPRKIDDIHAEWMKLLSSGVRPSIDPKTQWEKKRTKDLEKKRKALFEIEKSISDNNPNSLFMQGEFLKTLVPEEFSPKNIPAEFQVHLDFKKNIFSNIQMIFEKAKKAESKTAGTSERRKILLEQISQLEEMAFEQYEKLLVRSGLDDLMQYVEVKGRKLNLESGAIAYCGKSASDNLKLLRKAKAWDYWLHLKDYPGAHAIIHRSRGKLVPQEEVRKVALWVLKESLSSKQLVEGQRYAVVMVECRFVRPIKGDKLGRVTYHSETQFSIST